MSNERAALVVPPISTTIAARAVSATIAAGVTVATAIPTSVAVAAGIAGAA